MVRPMVRARLASGLYVLCALSVLTAANACGASKANPATLVADLYLMPSCPFAGEMLRSLLPTAHALKERFELRLHHIGEDKASGSDGPAELSSVYGPDDIARGKAQLCAQQAGGQRGLLAWLACSQDGRRDRPGAQRCAESLGPSKSAFDACFSGARGTELLRASFARARNAGVDGSPTLRLAGRPYHGGRSGAALARTICERTPAPTPPHCATLPTSPTIAVTLLHDRRCRARDCDVERFETFVRAELPEARVARLDWSDPRAPALFAQTGAVHLPVAIFGPRLTQAPDVYRILQRVALRRAGDLGFVLPLGEHHRPVEEPPSAVATAGGPS